MTATEAKVYDHVFQVRGMGVAPYQFVTVISLPASSLQGANPEAYRSELSACSAAAKSYGVDLCTCDYCGTSLVHNFVIRDAAGTHFIVGSDCVNKTGDAELITVTEAARREFERTKRQALAVAKHSAKEAAREAGLEAERNANGGFTLTEVRDTFTAIANAKLEAATAGICDELVSVIVSSGATGDFMTSIIADLNSGKKLFNLPQRAINILSEVYAKAKTGKTMRNAAAKAAQDHFYEVLDTVSVADAAAFHIYKAEQTAITNAYWVARKGNGVFVAPAPVETVAEDTTSPADDSLALEW